MKQIHLKSFFLILSLLLIVGQGYSKGVTIADGKAEVVEWSVERDGDNVVVEYKVTIAPNAVKRGEILVFAPTLTTYCNSYSLPPVVVKGRGLKAVIKRRNWLSKEKFNYENATYATNGESLALSATIPHIEWMAAVDLIFEAVAGKCTKYNRLPCKVVADALLPVLEVEVIERAALAELESQLKALEQQLVEAKKGAVVTEQIGQTLAIYFRVGSSKIEKEYRNNGATLKAIMEVVTELEALSESADKEGTSGRVVVAGFASPEGRVELNRKLGEERAAALREYIVNNSSLKRGQIMVLNGSIDWSTLRYLLDDKGNDTLSSAAQQLLTEQFLSQEERRELRSIIDNTPVWGRAFHALLESHFPQLRRAIFKIIGN